MARPKLKKRDTWIDMTPMSDVMVLLLTFFMLTSTFLKPEPVTVNTPMSVSEIKIPEQNIFSVLISPEGKVFLDIDNSEDRIEILEKLAANYNVSLTDKEKRDFSIMTSFGIPMQNFKQFMGLSNEEQLKLLPQYGVPTDSTDNQFKSWVSAAREVKGKEMVIAIKADQDTPYTYIKNVMGSLQDLKENRYNLITSLRKVEDEE
ncbi:MAG TPA: biopolymer transporter ExbD [Porphyromonadaceae bacterium]|jgi:biopolymer transport protein ExbD|uniref:ExbD/TolR family protein n=1 Tax=Limibacterium fermenti TaxID=3229863 RepID=UPI000E855AEB|nr:biopolymer transporter ExbD [Porphyromonadaceae bacterium]HBL33563.1 biopolymer transporter ExbD [Porphyromonadaceae bacterium]HBX20098.1 biopolymer transporter ExbD [Porphyromonadaceae bacterium]HBX45708.1 biopolymer transporter ExbD [Porphyromonadaceae bacterium]HCM20367.1 biopolymer transporter ExbD [Porphyromonadaceae bacterium]